jgi:putative hydrolase of the HAD superfamily
LDTAQGRTMSDGDGALRIVFDFGGVLFNWRPDVLVRRYLPQHVHDAASAQRLVAAVFQGFGGDWAQFDRGTVDAPELVRRIAARTGLDAHDVRALVDGVPLSLTPRPDTVDLLVRLRDAGATLHFLSNMPSAYADHLDRSHPQLMGHFHSGIYSSRVQFIKPEAAIYGLASKTFGAPAERLVLLDDIAANVTAAQANGWNALHFSDALACERELRAKGWWPAR